MIVARTERLEKEIVEHRLAYTCERCAHFEPISGRCASGYPNEDHREPGPEPRRSLVFCKEFELA
ncbi:MAG: hypothetical protein HOW73_13425 [Polyangiaceae bacterium]|nr:hypothetical protein [Polyangiaceae bacterium]